MKKHIPKIIILSSFLSVFIIAQTNAGGPGAGYTNAPSEDHCANSSCHNSNSLVTSGTAWNNIALRDKFTGSGYIPDSTYELVLTHRESGQSRSGFQITCLDKNDLPCGTFATLDSRTQTMSKSISSKTRLYLGHTSTGASTTSGDSSAYRISWTAPNKNLGNIKFYVTWNKGNGDNGSGGDVIYAKTFTVSPSSLLPSAKVKVLESNLCSGKTFTFDADVTGSPTAYNWIFPSGGSISSSTSTKPTVTYANSGTFKAILTLKNNKGTGNPDTLTFTVKPSPAASITPSTTQTICSGDSVQLSANSISTATYLWAPVAKTSRVSFFKDSGDYTVTVTGANGCSRTSTPVKIVVKPKPSVLLVKSFSGDTICSGSPFTLSGLITSGSVDSFSFVSASGPFIKSSSTGKSLNAGSATYAVWGKSPAGCVSPKSEITIHAKSASAGPALSSSNLDFTGFRVNWTAIGNATAYKISVDSGKSYITPSSGSNGLFHDVSGLIGNQSMEVRVFAITSGICATTDTSEIIITTKSCAPLDFSVEVQKDKVCKNSDATVVIHKVAGKRIGIKVDGVFVGTDTMQKIKVTATKNYTVSVIDSSALICGYTNTDVKLIEDTAVIPQTTPAGVFNICTNNTSVAQQVTVAANSKIDSIIWVSNGNPVAKNKQLSFNHTVSNGDSLWAFSQNRAGCVSEPSAKTYIKLNLIPTAGFSINNTQFDYTFTPNDATGAHKWKVGSDSSTTAIGTFDLTSFKNDSATIVHSITKNGCTSTTTVKVFVPDFAGTKNFELKGVQIYPNPANGKFQAFLPATYEFADLDILNTSGQIVLSARLKAGQNTIYTEALSPGMYLYKVQSSSKETTGSLIIER